MSGGPILLITNDLVISFFSRKDSSNDSMMKNSYSHQSLLYLQKFNSCQKVFIRTSWLEGQRAMSHRVYTNLSIVIAAAFVLVILSSLSMDTMTATANKAIMPINNINSSNAQNLQANNTQYSMIITKLLANNLQNHLQEAGSVLKITSKLPQVNNTSFAHLLNQTLTILHGIPKGADLKKRQIAQDILSNYKDLQIIFFLMPNGNVYLEEPYSRQQNLTTNNLAYRDYFQGAIKTHNTYLGNVVTSVSSGHRQAVIAVPIYFGKDNSTLIGIWAGAIDFHVLNTELQLLNLPAGERAVYVGHNGQKIADSNVNNSNKAEFFSNLQSFKNAINGKSGSNMEEVFVNGTTASKVFVTYHPVKAFQNTWAVLLMQKAR
jgi:cache domain-containing protein